MVSATSGESLCTAILRWLTGDDCMKVLDFGDLLDDPVWMRICATELMVKNGKGWLDSAGRKVPRHEREKEGGVGTAHGASRAPLFARRGAPPPRPIKSLAKPGSTWFLPSRPRSSRPSERAIAS